MKTFSKPQWLLLALTLPQVLLFLSFVSTYRIIGTLLKPEALELWLHYGLALGLLCLCATGYAVWAWRKQKTIHPLAALAILVGYIIFLYSYAGNSNYLIPLYIPGWMASNFAQEKYVFTALMPCLIHALFILVTTLTPDLQNKRAWTSLGASIVIPVFWYLLITFFLRHLHYSANSFLYTLLPILLITSTVIFLFCLIRLAYILACKWSTLSPSLALFWKIPVVLVFPLLGLALNNGGLSWTKHDDFNHLFGDFSSPWFYVLTVINALAVCLPAFTKPSRRFASWVLRALTYPFTVYFFLVFLPWFPFSVAAVIAFGLGFLLLSPLLLMVVHTQALYLDFKELRIRYKPQTLLVSFLAAFLVIPAALFFTGMRDRIILHRAMDYVYQPDLGKASEAISTGSILRALAFIRAEKINDESFYGLYTTGIPFLTPAYRWLVLDNLTLSDKKLDELECIFAGHTSRPSSTRFWNRMDATGVRAKRFETITHYIPATHSWETHLDLSLWNSTPQSGAEYITEFTLPQGCYIRNYELEVDHEMKKGLLAEKQAASWIYNQITSYRMDPGLLRYEGGNKASLHVSPFQSGETKHTCIDFIHAEPLVLHIDSLTIQLGDTLHTGDALYSGPLWLSSKAKAELPLVKRKPYYYFIVDMCEDNKG
ncbi:MAG TPA: MSEP-CTERM sorting domain-containing protein, partial [Bacteroidia bacterium]|nr:MSEP-CTERM sorting domain-containing protein [Bacteroidia bacterium]